MLISHDDNKTEIKRQLNNMSIRSTIGKQIMAKYPLGYGVMSRAAIMTLCNIMEREGFRYDFTENDRIALGVYCDHYGILLHTISEEVNDAFDGTYDDCMEIMQEFTVDFNQVCYC